MGRIAPKVGSLRVVDTTSDSITLQAAVKATNPTPYSATIPYANVHILHNGTLLGDATVRDLNIVTGANKDIVVKAKWNPHRSGDKGRRVGRDLISQYLSGYNTTLTVKAHRESIPGQPIICEGLSRFNFTFDTPRIGLPGGGSPDETGSHFIREATFHILSSTATFQLASPLEHNTIYLDFVNATAFYNHTEPVGRIEYDLPFAAPPGISETPRLPVDWSLGSVGYDALKNAVGGRLKLDARADVDVRLGNWQESFWFQGQGIGANVRL